MASGLRSGGGFHDRPAVHGRRLAVLTLLLGGLTAFGPLAMDLYLPAFPTLAADLHASEAGVQATLTADVIGLVLGQLVRLLLTGLVVATAAAAALVFVVLGTSLGLAAVLPPLFLVVASRGLVSANATVLGVERASGAGSASAVLGACMFGGRHSRLAADGAGRRRGRDGRRRRRRGDRGPARHGSAHPPVGRSPRPAGEGGGPGHR
jgi:hypothetical protein